jgi:hypothetical protein
MRATGLDDLMKGLDVKVVDDLYSRALALTQDG